MTSESKIRIERLKLENVTLDGLESVDSEPPVSSTGRAGSAARGEAQRSAGLGSAGLGSAGLGSAGLGSAGLGSAGLGSPVLGPGDDRTLGAWREWLRSMASDAEAAMAAAIAYRQLEGEDRDRWVDSLEADALSIDVPKIALYAPLIAVEHDPERRERLLAAIEDGEVLPEPSGRYRALSGRDARGARVCVVVQPLYLEFVQVLACAHDAAGFVWVRHDPIVDMHRAPRSGESLEGARLEATPMRATIDELASAILAHRRSKRPMPEALAVIEHLFDPADHASP